MAAATDAGTPYHHGSLRDAAVDKALAHLRIGYAALPTLRELAAGIGVTHRALYRHFPDKDALAAAVAGAGFDLLAAAMVHAGGQNPRTAITGYLRFALSEPGLYRLMFSLGSSALLREPYPGPMVRRVLAIATDAFAGADEATGTRDRVISAWGMAHGLVELWRNGALRADGPERAQDFILSRLAESGLI
jgi:AcrR family transcriptional regulator